MAESESHFSKTDFNLCLAAQRGENSTVKKLLNGGLLSSPANINAQNPEKGETPLILAAFSNNPDTVALLLDAGANPSIVDNGGFSAICYSIYHNQIESVCRMIDAGADLSVVTPTGSLLHHAIASQFPEMVDIVLKKGVPSDIKNYSGQSATAVAVETADMNILQVMADNHIKFTETDENGRTMAHVFCKRTNIYGNDGALEFLMKQGVEIGQPDNYGRTPLMILAKMGHMNRMESVLKNGVFVNAQDNDGNTALMYAIRSDNPEAVKLLLKYGADLTIQNNANETAMMLTDRFGQQAWYPPVQRYCTECAYLLLMNGAEPNDNDEIIDCPQIGSTYNPEIAYTTDGLTRVIDRMTSSEITETLKEHNDFFQQMVSLGIFVEVFQKLSYNQTKEYYSVASQKMPKDIKKQVEEIMRHKRERSTD